MARPSPGHQRLLYRRQPNRGQCGRVPGRGLRRHRLDQQPAGNPYHQAVHPQYHLRHHLLWRGGGHEQRRYADHNASAVQAAINAANAAGGGVVRVPAATLPFVCGRLTLLSNVKLEVNREPPSNRCLTDFFPWVAMAATTIGSPPAARMTSKSAAPARSMATARPGGTSSISTRACPTALISSN